MLNTSTASTCVVRLATNAESADQRAIALYVAFCYVVQQSTALTNELHESTASVMIALVNLEVLGEMRDPGCQERDLDLGRAGVCVVARKSSMICCFSVITCVPYLSRGSRCEPPTRRPT